MIFFCCIAFVRLCRLLVFSCYGGFAFILGKLAIFKPLSYQY